MSQPILTHVAFHSADAAASIAFYQDFAGMHVVHDRMDEGVRVAWLSREREDPSFVIVLIETGERRPADAPSFGHLGFACGSRAEVDAKAALARERGVPILHDGVELPPPVGYFTIVLDPDGNEVEFSYGQPINPKQL